jgi:signal transduction histidine kinase
MSHELRRPLNSMLVLAFLLQENKEDDLNDEQLEFVEVIHKSASIFSNKGHSIFSSKIKTGKLGIDLMGVACF